MKTTILALLFCLPLLGAEVKPRTLVWDHSPSWPACFYRMYDVTDPANPVLLADNIMGDSWPIPLTLTGRRAFYVTAANEFGDESVPSNTVTNSYGVEPPMTLRVTVTLTLP